MPELFHPHRTQFACLHEAEFVPAIDPQAERWYQEAEGMRDPKFWNDEIDWSRVITLYRQAAERKHWKAMIDLATLYQDGIWDGDKPLVERQPQAAMALTEEAMRLGIPLAWAVMGNYYRSGFLVPVNPTAAWAFWQRAADMGSPYAQTRIGKSLQTTVDQPEKLYWANRKIGLQMLECAFAQGDGNAAYELGLQYEAILKDNAKALHYYHEGVKMGSAACANSLFVGFSSVGKNAIIPGAGIDNDRAQRYNLIGDALAFNPAIRLPNLDKVLPLPPAKLPVWNGDKHQLINAAKAVVTPPPKLPPHPGSSRNNTRYYVPPGMTLPAEPIEVLAYWPYKAPRSGYWLLQLPPDPALADKPWQMRTVHELSQHLAPRHYLEREVLGMPNEWTDWDSDMQQAIMAMFWWELSPNQRINSRWSYLGKAIPLQQPALSPLVARQLALCIAPPEQQLMCDGNQTCPQTGIWQSSLAASHPCSKRWAAMSVTAQQAYVQAGQRFPVPPQTGTGTGAETVIPAGELRWQWLGSATANQMHVDGRMHISLPPQWQDGQG
ncbi:SEL1-like repeat protein [Undibacterium curvum]|uniref:Sel1 repeat family protein n=1 Tax=Undibacterium curvum TaxID=2762294 RepID=A0ABR7A728_9BURK|nr:DUF6396 domain-containing protein [Undibacterium curvum]MBC3932695.1 sel1 repeat family protein [Undibacterium curvum]